MMFFVQVDGLEWAFSNFPDPAMPRPDTDGVSNIRSLCAQCAAVRSAGVQVCTAPSHRRTKASRALRAQNNTVSTCSNWGI